MDQLAGPGPFVANRGGLGGPDDLAGHRVTHSQARRHRGGAGSCSRSGPGCRARDRASPGPGDARPGQPTPGPRPRPSCGSVSAAGARTGRRDQPRPQHRSGPPNDARIDGRSPSPGDMRDRHPLFSDPLHQQSPPMRRETSVTVRHEDLRGLWRRQSPQHRRSSLTSTRHQRPDRVQLAGRTGRHRRSRRWRRPRRLPGPDGPHARDRRRVRRRRHGRLFVDRWFVHEPSLLSQPCTAVTVWDGCVRGFQHAMHRFTPSRCR